MTRRESNTWPRQSTLEQIAQPDAHRRLEDAVNEPRCDVWTRRRFGLAAVGLGAVLPEQSRFGAADASKKRKKRRKRCRKLHQACQLGSKKQRCCKGMSCNDEANTASGLACCRDFQSLCDSESQCCNSLVCQTAEGLVGDRCCSTLGQPCEVNSDCCDGPGSGAFCDSEKNCVSPL